MIRAILTSGSMRSLRHKPDRSCAPKAGHISCQRHARQAGFGCRTDLIERDLRLGLEGDLLGHARRLAPRRIVSPLLRQVQAVSDRQTGRVIGKRERHGHLAVVLLAELAAVLTRDPNRVPALLGEAGIVNDPGLDGPSTLEGGRTKSRTLVSTAASDHGA